MTSIPATSGDLTLAETRSHFRLALILGVAADALQLFVFPMFAEGAFSPANDLLDFAVAAVLVRLLGWHWEFLPALAAELVPGVDLVPCWTIAVANVYRKWKQATLENLSQRV
jgi:hypothetical protein